MKRDATGRFVNSWDSETKRRVSLSLTNTAWSLLDEKARKHSISRSELIEYFARAASDELTLSIQQHRKDGSVQKKALCEEQSLQQQLETLQQQLVQERLARQQLENRLNSILLNTEDNEICQQTEQALRESENRFRAMFNQAAVGINQIGLDNRFLLVNAAFCTITGYSEEELLNMTWQDITHPEDVAVDLAYSQKLLTGEIDNFSIEKRYIHKSQAVVWVNLTSSIVRDANGHPKYTIGIIKDVTQRKQVELERDRLLQREQLAHLEAETERKRLNDILKQLPSLVAIVNGPNHTFEFANPTYLKVAKQTSDIIGKTFGEVFSKATYQLYLDILDRVYITGESCIEPELPIQCQQSDNSEIEKVFLSCAFLALKNSQEVIQGVLIHGIDVTAQVKARQQIEQLLTDLQQTEKRQQFLLELNDAIRVIQDVQETIWYVVCTTGKYFKANRCTYAEVDLVQHCLVVESSYDFCNGVDKTIGKHAIQLFSPALIIELNQGKTIVVHDIQTDSRITQESLKALTALQVRSLLCVPFMRGGECTSLLMVHHAEPYHWTQDEVSLMEQIAEYAWLTLERSRAEQALREGEAHLQLALKVGRLGTWDWDMTTNAIAWSEGHFTVLGLQPNECEPSYDVWASRVHPDDLAETEASMRKAIAEKTEYYHEYRLRWPDGTIRWVEARGQFIYDAHQVPKRSIGAVIDITERKTVEQEREQLLLREKAARTQAEMTQRQLKAIVETSPVGIALLDAEQRFIAINEALAEVSGLSQAKHLGHSIAEIFGHVNSTITQVFDEIYATGQPFISPNFPLYVPGRSDRRPGYYNVYYLPSTNETGKVESVLAYVVDVTERFRLEQNQRFLADASKVLSSSLDYQTTLMSIAQLAVPHLADWCTVHVVDETGKPQRLAVAHVDPEKVAWANELDRRYPYDPDSPRGLAQVLRTGQSELYPEISDALLVQAARDEDHLRILREVGFSSVIIVPLQIHNHTLGAISFVAAESGRLYSETDLALAEDLGRRAALAVENARLYQAAQRDRTKAEFANRVKDEFLAVLSHELRSPLNPILGWTKLLRTRDYDAPTRDRALEIIERNAKLQSQLIEDLLDVSRILRGKLSLENASVNLETIIKAAIETVRLAAEAKAIDLQFKVGRNAEQGTSHPTEISVMGDAARLQQVVWNLLSNAVKFTPEGGQVEVKLESCAFSSESFQLNASTQYSKSNIQNLQNYAQITVIDTGKGISPDFLPYVFEYFRQEDGSTTRKFGGLGLGLAIVRHLTELHGGTVSVDSQGHGQGSTFTVRLPLLKKTNPQQASTPDLPSMQSFIESSPLDGLRILVIDDETDTRDLVVFVLTQAGASVISASSAAEAFKILTTFSVNLLVCDIGMPEMDGYTLMQNLHRRAENRRYSNSGHYKVPPAIALTAYAGEANQQKAIKAGFQMHYSKPIEPEKLINAIVQLLKK